MLEELSSKTQMNIARVCFHYTYPVPKPKLLPWPRLSPLENIVWRAPFFVCHFTVGIGKTKNTLHHFSIAGGEDTVALLLCSRECRLLWWWSFFQGCCRCCCWLFGAFSGTQTKVRTVRVTTVRRCKIKTRNGIDFFSPFKWIHWFMNRHGLVKLFLCLFPLYSFLFQFWQLASQGESLWFFGRHCRRQYRLHSFC